MKKFKAAIIIAFGMMVMVATTSMAISSQTKTETTNVVNTNIGFDEVEKSIDKKSLSLKQKLALKAVKKLAKKVEKKKTNAGDNQVIALILVLLVGALGVHRFYLGYTWQGVVQLLTAGGCGIWVLIDLVRIITGSLQPKDGSYSTTL